MNHSLGIAIESLVAVLLMLTIGYCMLLNKRLERLKADENSLKATIAELITATEIAERAIGSLKHAVRGVNEDLERQLTTASQMSLQLKGQLIESDGVIRRLAKIAIAARPATASQAVAPKEPIKESTKESARALTRPSTARAVAAAAEAFSERKRAGGLAA